MNVIETKKISILNNIASVYYVKSDWLNTIKFGTEYIRLFKKFYHDDFPPNSWCLDRVAKAYLNSHQFEEAINYFEQSVKSENNPRLYDSYGNLGFVRFKLNQYRLAIEAYESAIKVLESSKDINDDFKNLNLSIFYNWLGVLYSKIDEKNKKGLCFTHYTNAIDKDSKNPSPYINIAILYAERNEYQQVEKSIEKGIALMDKNIGYHKELVSYILSQEELLKNERTKQLILNLLRSKNLINKDSYDFLASNSFQNKEYFINERQCNKLKILISESDLDATFDELLVITKNKNTINNDVLLLLGEYTRTNRQLHLGIISSSECKIVINRISVALLSIIEKLHKNKSI